MSVAPMWDSSQKTASTSWDNASQQALQKGPSPSNSWDSAQHQQQTQASPSSSGAGTVPESTPNGTPNKQQQSPPETDDSPSGAADDSSAEGVWSPDIEQAFQEALAIYPPCGRRKIILSDEGKMYGRNELIARYIKLRTGKNRTRKQVSSHIQVLARKKSREIQTKIKDHAAKEQALQGLASMSSAQIVSASAIHSKMRTPFGLASIPMGMPGMIDHGNPHQSPTFLKQEMNPLMSPPTMWGHPGLAQPMAHGLIGFGQPTLMTSPVVVSSVATPAVTMMPTMAGMGSAAPMSQMNTSSPRSVSPVQRGSQFSGGNSPGDAITGVSKLAISGEWNGCCLAAPKLKLIEYDAFVETPADDPRARKHSFIHLEPLDNVDSALEGPVALVDFNDKFPDRKGGLKDLYDRGPPGAFFLVKFWADIDTNIPEDANAFYGVTSQFEARENITIQCSTKVCSFGQQVVEKVETGHSTYEDGRFVFRIDRSPMCEYMISFIHKLQRLPEKYMMNSVLENFTVLQVVTNRDTQETLLSMACMFEVSMSDDGVRHKVFRLIGE